MLLSGLIPVEGFSFVTVLLLVFDPSNLRSLREGSPCLYVLLSEFLKLFWFDCRDEFILRVEYDRLFSPETFEFKFSLGP